MRAVLKIAVVMVLWLPAALYVGAWTSTRLGRHFTITDAWPYATAVYQIERGESMYDPLPPSGPHRTGPYYLYPPILAPLLSWGPDGDLRAVQRIAYVLAILGLVLLVMGIARLAGGPVLIVSPILLFLLMKLKPVIWTLDSANVSLFVSGLVAAGLAFATPFAVPLLTLAAALKVTPAWAALTLAIREPRRALLPLLVTTAALTGAAVFTIGTGPFLDATFTWLRNVAPTLSQGQFASGTFTVGGVERPLVTFLVQGNLSPIFAPLFLLGDPYPGELPGWASFYLTVASIALPLAVAWWTRRSAPRDQAAFVLAAATLASPIFRLAYVTLLLPAAAIGIRRLRERHQRTRANAQPHEVWNSRR
jgi:hypothetical protein